MATKQDIKDCISTAVSNFAYYDRKNDEVVTVTGFEEAVRSGEITISDIVKEFEIQLREQLKYLG